MYNLVVRSPATGGGAVVDSTEPETRQDVPIGMIESQ